MGDHVGFGHEGYFACPSLYFLIVVGSVRRLSFSFSEEDLPV
jgi:hypothetical protein